jgi:hypothetical protein
MVSVPVPRLVITRTCVLRWLEEDDGRWDQNEGEKGDGKVGSE